MTTAAEVVKELRELLAKATKGPWRSAKLGSLVYYIQSQHVRHPNADGVTWADVGACGANNYDNEANAALIVAAVNHLPALVECAEALKRVKHELMIPAAEYVPAIPAVWDIIDRALSNLTASTGDGS